MPGSTRTLIGQPDRGTRAFVLMAIMALLLAMPSVGQAQPAGIPAQGDAPWWIWSLGLFAFCLALGVIAVLGGVGGGVLYVPFVSSFFPIHLDFVRAAGLVVALAGSLSAGPVLLRKGYAYLKIATPVALLASAFSILGSMVGLALPTRALQLGLGLTILAVLAIMASARKSEHPEPRPQDRLSLLLGLSGGYLDESGGRVLRWSASRTLPALGLFCLVGFTGGLFGLGAGWANVPVLNLLMGLPLKVAAGSSNFILSVSTSSAAWIYLQSGAALPIVVIPSTLGMVGGARIGAALLPRVKPRIVRAVVMAMLLVAGLRSLMKGLGW